MTYKRDMRQCIDIGRCVDGDLIFGPLANMFLNEVGETCVLVKLPDKGRQKDQG